MVDSSYNAGMRKNKKAVNQDFETIKKLLLHNGLPVPCEIVAGFKTLEETKSAEKAKTEDFLSSPLYADIIRRATILIEGRKEKLRIDDCELDVEVVFCWDYDSPNHCGVGVCLLEYEYVGSNPLTEDLLKDSDTGDISHFMENRKEIVKFLKPKISNMKMEIDLMIKEIDDLDDFQKEIILDEISCRFDEVSPKQTEDDLGI